MLLIRAPHQGNDHLTPAMNPGTNIRYLAGATCWLTMLRLIIVRFARLEFWKQFSHFDEIPGKDFSC